MLKVNPQLQILIDYIWDNKEKLMALTGNEWYFNIYVCAQPIYKWLPEEIFPDIAPITMDLIEDHLSYILEANYNDKEKFVENLIMTLSDGLILFEEDK